MDTVPEPKKDHRTSPTLGAALLPYYLLAVPPSPSEYSGLRQEAHTQMPSTSQTVL